nr:hypothetical protein [Tanacetum cinerariifolium]
MGLQTENVLSFHLPTWSCKVDFHVWTIVVNHSVPMVSVLLLLLFRDVIEGVSVWERAEAVHLQAEETKLEYSSRSPKIFSRILDFIRIVSFFFVFVVGNIVTNSREMPSWREIVSLTVLVKLASYT